MQSKQIDEMQIGTKQDINYSILTVLGDNVGLRVGLEVGLVVGIWRFDKQ